MGFGLTLCFGLHSISEFLANTLRVFPCVRRRFRFRGDIRDKVIVITGGNSGIGQTAAELLAERGAKIIIGARDVDKGNKVVDGIRERNPSADVRVISLDLASLASVRKFAQQVNDEETRIDILINNAGVGLTPKWKTKDGFEMQFGTNHLGHFLLTALLLERLKAAPKPRVVAVASLVYMGTDTVNFDDINLDAAGAYAPFKAYCRSKLANVMFVRELAKRTRNTNLRVYAAHPGAVRTDFDRHMKGGCLKNSILRLNGWMFMKSMFLGAQTTLYCALDEGIAGESGNYYRNCSKQNLKPHATNETTNAKLWDMSCEMVGLEENLRLN